MIICVSFVPACHCSKGATLGCFKLTCRASYHLACARKYKCMLQASSRGVCLQWLAEGAASLRCEWAGCSFLALSLQPQVGPFVVACPEHANRSPRTARPV